MEPSMKKFPVNYSKEELIEEIQELWEKLSSSILSDGEKEHIIVKIRMGQIYLNSKNATANNKQLEQIIANNQNTSRNTKILSGILIVIAVGSFIFNLCIPHKAYTTEVSQLVSSIDSIKVHTREMKRYIDEVQTNTKEDIFANGQNTKNIKQ